MRLTDISVSVAGVPEDRVVIDYCDTEKVGDPVEFTIKGRCWPISKEQEKPVTPLQKRCQELLPVIQAGAEGKMVQVDVYGGYADMDNGCTDFRMERTYRIKPEPKYRPYTPEEAVKLLGKTLQYRTGTCENTVGFLSLRGVRFNGHSESTSFLELRDYYVHLDGSPCGVLVEE